MYSMMTEKYIKNVVEFIQSAAVVNWREIYFK